MKVTLYSQILQHLDRRILRKSVQKYQTDKYNKEINTKFIGANENAMIIQI